MGTAIKSQTVHTLTPSAKIVVEAAKYVDQIKAILQDEMGNSLPNAVIYAVLRDSGMLARIQHIKSGRGGVKKFDDYDLLSPIEQLEKQKRALYEKAATGDIPAQKLWFEQHFESLAEQTFNVQVEVKDYRIKDASLRSIAMAADRHIVHDILGGIRARLESDGFSREVIELCVDFDEKFQLEAIDIYAPKNE